MKKALVMGGAALLAFALVFSACNDANDLTMTEAIPYLPGPANLRAVNDQKGVVTLTWDSVYDAETYEVYRKTGDEPQAQLFGSENPLFSDGTNRYDDVVSATNKLDPTKAYTYTVVAVSATSTAVPRARGVEVIQNGQSTVRITPNATAPNVGIPAQGDATVVTAVTGLTAELNDSGSAIEISWNKNPNPGIYYKVEFPGSTVTVPSSSPYNFSFSPDGAKVAYKYSPTNSLIDGEKYKVKVTANYRGDYYPAAAAAEIVYEHTDPTGVISSFGVSPITLYDDGVATGHYNVSVYWRQDQTAPAGVSYKLYRHKDDVTTSYPYPPNPYDAVEWEPVSVTIPAADTIGLIQITLNGADRPAYRQEWTYKVAAEVDGEEVDSAEAALTTDAWSTTVPSSLSYTATGESGRKIKIAADRITTGLYPGDEIEFYAVLTSQYNADDKLTASDAYLSRFTLIGALAKANLEDADTDKRSFTSAALSNAGLYTVMPILKNGAVRIYTNNTKSNIEVKN
jgi:hypothetical protein